MGQEQKATMHGVPALRRGFQATRKGLRSKPQPHIDRATAVPKILGEGLTAVNPSTRPSAYSQVAAVQNLPSSVAGDTAAAKPAVRVSSK